MTRMPPEHYQLVEAELESILAAINKTDFKGDVSWTKHFIEVGEYGLAFETLCEVIIEEGCSIPETIYQKIVNLAHRMKIDKKIFDNIKVDKSAAR